MSRYIPMPAYIDRMPVDISFVFEFGIVGFSALLIWFILFCIQYACIQPTA